MTDLEVMGIICDYEVHNPHNTASKSLLNCNFCVSDQ